VHERRVDARPRRDAADRCSVVAQVAVDALDRAAVIEAVMPEGIALRYANLYGGGTGMTDPAYVDLVRKQRLPIIGSGAGVWSLVHVDDAAVATVAAIEHGLAETPVDPSAAARLIGAPLHAVIGAS
jgi:hypothetical protein